MIKTKIVCTIGPASSSREKILQLAEAGMDVARLNFSHGSHEEHGAVIQRLQEVRQQLGKPLAIMLDTKGPEIRLGKFQEGKIYLLPGQTWTLTSEVLLGNEKIVSLHPPHILRQLVRGMRILFNDGCIAATVVGEGIDHVQVLIENGGPIASNQGVNLPNTDLHLPAVTAKDIEDITFGCGVKIDLIAASFIRSPEQILEIRQLVTSQNAAHTLLIAKIENHTGVQNFDAILEVADGIMVARGDLGVEVPLSHVPRLQKMMIRKCYLSAKPVVTATQMLESMIHHPRPTRAESSDVANAIYDSTSSVMLSGETANGKYPVESVLMMREIAQETEEDFNYRAFFDEHLPLSCKDIPSAITLAAVKTAYQTGAKAIFVLTETGQTARLIARLRPKMAICALTTDPRTYHQLAFNWGVFPYFIKEYSHVQQGVSLLSRWIIEKNLGFPGDPVVVVAVGPPFALFGPTPDPVLHPIHWMMVETLRI